MSDIVSLFSYRCIWALVPPPPINPYAVGLACYHILDPGILFGPWHSDSVYNPTGVEVHQLCCAHDSADFDFAALYVASQPSLGEKSWCWVLLLCLLQQDNWVNKYINNWTSTKWRWIITFLFCFIGSTYGPYWLDGKQDRTWPSDRSVFLLW